MRQTVVLGVNAAHDAAACLLVDGQIRAAITEDRLSRTKRYEGYPHRAQEYCLEEAGLAGLEAVDTVVINEYVRDDHGIQLRNAGYKGELVINPSHHMLHAYYAWAASGFERPSILVIDGSGYSYGEYLRRHSPLLGEPPEFSEMEEAESMFRVSNDRELDLVYKRWGLWESTYPYMRFPSLGHMFSVASEYIFGHVQHAGKTMGLAPYGDAAAYPDPIIEYTSDGLVIDTEWITRLPPRSAKPAHLDQVCRDVAAKVQEELERAVIHLCNKLHEATGTNELCLSGGVGLNSVANGLILRQTPFTKLFVTPAADDSGTAIGAALYGHQRLTGELPIWDRYDNYHGRSYSNDEVGTAVGKRNRFIQVEKPEDVADAAARDIAAGRFVGWFECGSEFGPRALGRRSIVCDPRPRDMRDRLNATVKFREPFRPYAASVLTEHVDDYFEVVDVDPFMMTVVPVRESKRDVIRSVCHIDDTCRIQTVDPDHSGEYRRLIERFHEISGIPLVLNTSYNVRGEPIVESPDDAIRCFLSCNLDILYLNGLRITKWTAGSAPAPADLVPCFNDGVSVHATIENVDGAASAPSYYYQTRTGYRSPLTAEEFELLTLIDAQQSIAHLAELRGDRPLADAIAAIDSLQRRGLLCMAR
jgi:carbamoyltransferase